MRLSQLSVAVMLIATVAAAGVAVILEANTFTPRIETYELSEDQRRITVFVCGQTNDVIADRRARADARAVTVRVRLRRDPDPNLFHHGASFSAVLMLDGPLGDRVVRDELGNTVPAGPHLCPG